uniref:Uncharacterized protein n=1 Tax=viral metagenome TaxID=1070528 RepID=A0A6C0EEV9_9ZZZZ
MKLTKSSELLLGFFKNHKCIPFVSCNNTSKKIFRSLYNDICDANNYLESIKRERNGMVYKRTLQPIKSRNDLPNFNNFPSNIFTKEVQNHIDMNMKLILRYSLQMFNRKINIHFIIEHKDYKDPGIKTLKYDKYVNCILLWYYILNKYSSIHCSKEWNIYLYFTSLEKQLPNKNIHLQDNILNYNHINTGFTTTCPQISEIVIFRKEEWFKVFIHESFHNFALDFSDMNVSDLNKAVLAIFPIQSNGNLFEAYTEFWAEIVNISFCSYFYSKKSDGFDGFLSNVDLLIQYERIYSFFQLNKVLNYMGLTYKNLYSKDKTSAVLRETLYKENTNIFAYYVIKCMLMHNYNGFLTWCYQHNGASNIIQFSKTQQNLYDFYSFIKKNYKTVSFENNIDCMEKYMLKWQRNMYSGVGLGTDVGKVRHSHMYYLLNNMKMSIFELE